MNAEQGDARADYRYETAAERKVRKGKIRLLEEEFRRKYGMGSEEYTRKNCESSLVQSGGQLSASLANYMIRYLSNVDDMRSLTRVAVPGLKAIIAEGTASPSQMLLVSLHIGEHGMRDAFEEGRSVVNASQEWVGMGGIYGERDERRVEKSVFYDIALNSEEGGGLVEKVRLDKRLSFRAAVVRSIRFLRSDEVLGAVVDEYLSDERDVVPAFPHSDGKYLRVCDIAAHELEIMFGLEGAKGGGRSISRTASERESLRDLYEEARAGNRKNNADVEQQGAMRGGLGTLDFEADANLDDDSGLLDGGASGVPMWVWCAAAILGAGCYIVVRVTKER
ncbi:hypothetical protein [Sulfuriroseicoccus oceanibius]|uniref:Uncharacterized protein n=1 Tax=Sulfuriroseicoccus oceanibius TaxID=2707525 RepID=A0A6B3L4R4_9BACT|nr:hypothetical protein [Sulfuriroseicoccus oceanibius]QQL46017.1 hypothetical protein G3M56_005405 [Sulfuriroseicoccus oceanibius]